MQNLQSIISLLKMYLYNLKTLNFICSTALFLLKYQNLFIDIKSTKQAIIKKEKVAGKKSLHIDIY